MNFETLIDTEYSRLLRVPGFISQVELAGWTEEAMALPLVERPEIRIFGQIRRQQRNVGFFAEPGVSGYRYSGQQTTVNDIGEFGFLQEILKRVNQGLESEYNGILVNLYENGERYIGAHSDDENGLASIGVASVAFGATRIFRIRDKKTKKIVCNVEHRAGDLLLMSGDFQKEFTHEIPIQKRITEPRVSLTFRRHV